MKIFLFIMFLFGPLTYSQEKETVANCITDYKVNTENLDELIIVTCVLKNFKFVSTGSPDYKGRYLWDYEVYKLIGENYVKISNSDIFKYSENLEMLINKEIKKSYESDAKNEDLAACMAFVTLRKFNLNEMRISFDDPRKVQFIVSFGLPSACLNVDQGIIEIPISKFITYLK